VVHYRSRTVPQSGDSIEQPPAITNQGDAEVPKILRGQARQYVSFDPVLAERILVLLQPEGAQPARDVQIGHPVSLPQ
jgi:hypothetical protein